MSVITPANKYQHRQVVNNKQSDVVTHYKLTRFNDLPKLNATANTETGWVAMNVGYTAVTPIGKLQPATRTAAVFTPIPQEHNNLFNTRKHTFARYQQL